MEFLRRHNTLCAAGLLLALAFFCYWRILDNYYFLDDTGGLFAGYLLSHDFSQIFHYNFDTIYMSRLWRVVDAASFVPNYLISGIEPWSYFLVNILLHFGCSLLCYLITRTISRDRWQALLTAVLFGICLNKADAVMMIAHRTTLLGAFFSLASFYCFTRALAEGPRAHLVVLQ